MAATPERRSVKGTNEVEEYHFHTCGNENGEPLFLHHGTARSCIHGFSYLVQTFDKDFIL